MDCSTAINGGDWCAVGVVECRCKGMTSCRGEERPSKGVCEGLRAFGGALLFVCIQK